MPILFFFVAILLIVSAINDKTEILSDLVVSDFKGSDKIAPFQIWILALFLIGALGYVKQIKPLANAFLVLVILIMILSNKGFFGKLTSSFGVK